MYKCQILCFIFAIFTKKIDCDVEAYYENVILEGINASVEYTLPLNNFEEKPIHDDVKEYGTFDFIIVGAGASGAVLARRLSDAPTNWKILLIDAGKFGNDLTDIPGVLFNTMFSNYSWGYTSIPQTTCCLDMLDKKCFYPRGKGIGGSTLINGLIYSRASSSDFDNWGESIPGWSYKDVLPYFKKSENFMKTDKKAVVDENFHGSGGPLNVEHRVPRHPLVNVWLEANKEKGYSNVDLNGMNSTGVSVTQFSIKNGRRQDTGTAFVKPIKNKPNLTILTESFVTSIIINETSKTANGIRFVHKNQKYTANATKEVILSAGSFGSPQILMLSGIGPKEHLKEVNIPLIANLEVGSTLRDHPSYWGLFFDADYNKENKSLRYYVKDFLEGKGSLTAPVELDSLGYYNLPSKLKTKFTDFELIIAPNDGFVNYVNQRLSEAKQKTFLNLYKTNGFGLYIVQQNPRSVGTIRLKNNDPFEFPLIDSKFLSDPENYDLENLYQAIQFSLDIILNTTAFKKINTTLYRQQIPDCDTLPYLSKEYWSCALRYFTWNIFHPVGTCPMGLSPENGAVVDSEARVYGIKKLRVVDASIYPQVLSGHPTAQCIMFGEKISASIIKEYYRNCK